MRFTACLGLILIVLGSLTISKAAQKAAAPLPDEAQLNKMAARFAPTPIRVDVSKLSSGDRQALAKLIEAARVLNDIFMKQLWDGNAALYAKLQQDKELYLHADRKLEYGFVVDVMATAKRAGVENLGMVTDPLSDK